MTHCNFLILNLGVCYNVFRMQIFLPARRIDCEMVSEYSKSNLDCQQEQRELVNATSLKNIDSKYKCWKKCLANDCILFSWDKNQKICTISNENSEVCSVAIGKPEIISRHCLYLLCICFPFKYSE